MADNELTTANSSGSGVQATTQSPQSVGSSPATGTQSSSVQPGTAPTLLNSQQGGVSLHGTALSTVSLGGATTTATAAPPISPPKHHINPALFGFSALLLVVAAVLFWITSRSAKNTTQY